MSPTRIFYKEVNYQQSLRSCVVFLTIS